MRGYGLRLLLLRIFFYLVFLMAQELSEAFHFSITIVKIYKFIFVSPVKYETD